MYLYQHQNYVIAKQYPTLIDPSWFFAIIIEVTYRTWSALYILPLIVRAALTGDGHWVTLMSQFASKEYNKR